VFTTIDVPDAAFTDCSGINNAGQINFVDASGAPGFLLGRGTFTTLDVPGASTVNGSATRAQGINASDDIVGDFDDAQGTHGYRYDRGAFSIIDVPGAYYTQALGISTSGDIVGAAAFRGIGGYSGFFLSHGIFTILNNPAATSAGSPVTTATAINNQGQIVGYFTDASAYRAFIYDNGVFTELDLPPGADNESFATGINDAGQIVGYFNSATGNHGFFATQTDR
jgi:probable HAF family extracellular repeat protein